MYPDNSSYSITRTTGGILKNGVDVKSPLFLIGEAHLANLRAAELQPEQREFFETQFAGIVAEYQRLLGAPSCHHGDFRHAGESAHLLRRVAVSRRNAMDRAAHNGEWGSYYGERLHLPWLRTYGHLARLALYERFGWFSSGAAKSREAVMLSCGKVVPIRVAAA